MSYQRGQSNYRGNNQTEDYVLESLCQKFAGRGLAMQAKISADKYGADGAYSYNRRNSSQPLTLEEFEAGYRARSGYASSAAQAVSSAAHRNAAPAKPIAKRPAPARAEVKRPEQPQRKAAPVRNSKPAPAAKEKAIMPEFTPRRAVKKDKKRFSSNLLVRNFRGLPVGAMLTVVVCAVSLMFIVGSSVLLRDASSEYSNMQSEISALAKEQDKLMIELEVKNDLRTIESIAVGELGMVKKDLVARHYVKLSDEDVIETFEEPETNVGLSTLLSAIRGGK